MLSRRNTRFRDNRRLTMTLPLVTIARLAINCRVQQGLLPSPPFLAPGDLSAPATDRFAIAISRRGITIVSPSTSPWIFQSPNELVISVSVPPATPRMIIRGYDNVHPDSLTRYRPEIQSAPFSVCSPSYALWKLIALALNSQVVASLSISLYYREVLLRLREKRFFGFIPLSTFASKIVLISCLQTL